MANGRELNPDEYVLSNWKLRDALKELFLGIVKALGHDNFIFQVTGGDRYRDAEGEIKSATTSLTVVGSSQTSPHLVERGARAADLRVRGVSDDVFDEAAADAGLPEYNTIRNYGDNHTHVGLPNVPSNYTSN